MKAFFILLMSLCFVASLMAQQSIYDVSVGNGNGVNTNPGRGWTWGQVWLTLIAALSNTGNNKILNLNLIIS